VAHRDGTRSLEKSIYSLHDMRQLAITANRRYPFASSSAGAQWRRFAHITAITVATARATAASGTILASARSVSAASRESPSICVRRKTTRDAFRRHRALVALSTCATCLFADGVSKADEDAAYDKETSETRAWAFNPELQFGGYDANGGGGGMMLFGADILAHYRFFEWGALAEGGTQILGGSMGGLGGWLGTGLDLTPHLRLSLLGELGRHGYSDIGAEFFGHPGIGGSFGYGGARVGLMYGFGGADRFTLGFWMFARDDFGRRTETVHYTEHDLFAPPTNATWTGTVGQAQFGLTLRVGVESGWP
jgi:hypothetical protein